jgi:hypothetical protein
MFSISLYLFKIIPGVKVTGTMVRTPMSVWTSHGGCSASRRLKYRKNRNNFADVEPLRHGIRMK